MKETLLLIKTKLRMLYNGVKFAKGSKWIKIAILSAIGAGFMWGLYKLFLRIFVYLHGVPLIGPLLIIRMISMIFMVFFAMLIFSNIITAFSSLYFSSDLYLLLLSPLRFRSIFSFKFFETMTYSNWMVLFFLTPVLGAYGKTQLVPVGFFLWVLIVLLPYFVICTSIGIMITVTLMRIFPTKKTRDISLIFGVVIGASAYLIVRLLQPEKLVNPEVMIGVMQYLVAVRTPVTKFLPSFWITQSIISMVKSNPANAFFYFGILSAVAFALSFVTIFFSRRMYYPGWAGAQEGGKRHTKQDGKKRAAKKRIFPFNISSPIRALVTKDVKTFFRETSQWSQLLILLTLIVVYLYNIHKLPLPYFYLKSIISFLNIGLAGFVLASVALRFVFPAVSLEKNNFWIIRSAPISVKQFIWEKFWISLFPLLILAACLIVFSNIILEVDMFFMVISCATVIIMTVALTALGIGMGAIFPRFHVENVAQIESSAGGMFYMIFSLAYVAAILVLEAGPVRMYFVYKLSGRSHFRPGLIIFLGVIFVVVNLAVIFIPMMLGIKKIKNLEM
ncbi:MAG: hypothetical protein ABH868_02880 [bacterium]